MQQPPEEPRPNRKGLLKIWQDWVDAVGLQSVLFALLTVLSAFAFLGLTWYLFPELFG